MIDFNLNPGEPILDQAVPQIYQQVDILFDTTPGDLLGDVEYGTDYEYNLYDLKISADALSEQMEQDLNNVDLFGYWPSVKTYLLQGTERDIAVISVDLQNIEGHTQYRKSYKIV